MKKFLFVMLFMAFPSFLLFSEGNDASSVVERVYVSTDKDVYIAGDNLWCSAFCFDASAEEPHLSNLSSVVYIELSSNDGVAQTAKMGLLNGRGAGKMELRADLPTGNYRLVAYTAINKDEKGFIPEGKTITIYNTLSIEKVKDNVEIDNGNGPAYGQSHSNSVSVKDDNIVLPKDDIHKSESFPMAVKNPNGEKMYLSVSIYNEDSISSLRPYCISDFLQGTRYKSHGEVKDSIIPDYEGEVIRMNVVGNKKIARNLLTNKDTILIIDDFSKYEMLFSVSGPDGSVYCSPISSNGDVEIYTSNIYGEKDVFCQLLKGSVIKKFEINIEDPFVRYPAVDVPKLVMSRASSDRLSRRGVMMQIEKRYSSDTLYDYLVPKPSFYLTDGKKYHLDDYTRFPVMSEVFIEFIPELSRRTVNGVEKIKVKFSDVSFTKHFSDSVSLFLLDGVPVFDHKKIIDYDPLLVKDITIYPNRYHIGDLSYDGVVRFDTYKGNLPSFNIDKKVMVFRYKGLMYPMAYTCAKIKDNIDYPDFRHTLYWNPIVEIPAGESFNLECITPMYTGDFTVIVEGITETGKPIYYKSSFQVR